MSKAQSKTNGDYSCSSPLWISRRSCWLMPRPMQRLGSCSKLLRRRSVATENASAIAWFFGTLIAITLVQTTECRCELGDGWLGWRGLEKQGCAEGGEFPTEWSVNRNVRWKVNIPGEGHSSPVVAGDQVLVTSAIHDEGNAATRQVVLTLMGVIMAAMCVVHCSCIVQSCRVGGGPSHGRMLSFAAYCALLGLMCYAIADICLLWGTEDHYTQYLCWLQSNLVVALLLLILGLHVTRGSKWNYAFVGAALILPCVALCLRPNPEYYALTKVSARHFAPTCTAVGIMVLVAGLLAGRALRAAALGNASPPVGSAEARLSWFRMLLCGIAFAIGLLGLGVIPGLAIIKTVRYDDFSLFPQGVFGYQWFDHVTANRLIPTEFSRMAQISIGVVLWCIAEFAGGRYGPVAPRRWVSSGFVFVTAVGLCVANRGEEAEGYLRAIVCVDSSDGSIRWVCEGLRGPSVTLHKMNSLATPTPVVHHGQVFAYFGNAGMMCADLEGNLLWTNTDLPYEGVHGAAASPLPCDGLVIVASQMASDPYLTALDSSTGDQVWRTDLPGWSGSHGDHRPPVISSIGEKKVVLIWRFMSDGNLAAYDTRTGKELWAFPLDADGKYGGEAVATMLIRDDVLYLPNQSRFTALRLGTDDDGEPVEVLWDRRMGSSGPNTSSPVLVGDLMFSASDKGIATCLDAKSGRVVWKKRLPKGSGGAKHLASPVSVGKYVLFCDTRGMTTVIAGDSRFQILAENRLDGEIYASPAAVGGQVFIRSTQGLWCIAEE